MTYSFQPTQNMPTPQGAIPRPVSQFFALSCCHVDKFATHAVTFSQNAVTGGGNGQYVPSSQHQPAVMMDLFPDLRQPYMPPPAGQLDPQQPPEASGVPQPTDDILAGNLDQLKQHLQIARVCHAQKASSSQADAQSKQAAASQHAQSTALQMQAPAQANGAMPPATQAGRQQRRPQPPPHASSQRSRQQSGSDRWLNDPQPPLNRSISPSLPMNHAAPPSLQQHYPQQMFLQPSIRDGINQGQSGQHALQQQALRRGQHMQQQRPGSVPRQETALPRSSSADDLQRHALVPEANSTEPARPSVAQFARSSQQPDASGGQVRLAYTSWQPLAVPTIHDQSC